MTCPDVETLERMVSGELEPEQRAVIADHAAGCRDCRELLDVLLDVGVEATGDAATVGTGGAPAVPHLGVGVRDGTRIDRYVIERRIGHGGMGVVYAARDPELGRGVAIKMLRPGAPAERLRREAQALARLSHPNVVAVHDVGEHEGQTFIAMALIDGDNLRQWLETTRSFEDILRVLRAAGRGIVAAHAAGMIHRDLKPDNIFIARDGAVLVGDFGLARDVKVDGVDTRSFELATPDRPPDGALDGPVEMTATGTILGTPAYMAPEQAGGEATTEASDQFAFCVTAWEALLGERPFQAKTFTALQTQIAAGEITAPKAERGVTSRVQSALRRGLARDPVARFPSMEALLAELAPRPRRWPWLAAAAALVAIAVVAGFALRQREPAIKACDTGHLLDEVWGPAQRAAPTLTSLATTRLDTYAQHWLAVRNELCVTHDELSREAADARLTCLDQRRTQLGVVIAAVATTPDAASARRAIDGLPAIDDCGHATTAPPLGDRAAAAAQVLQLAKLETAYAVGTGSLAEVRALAREAERAGSSDTLIAALILESALLHDAGLADQAEPLLRRALGIAERSRDDLARVRTSIELVDVLVRLQRLADAHNVVDQAAAILARVGTSHELELELVMARSTILAGETDHRAAAELLRGYVVAREHDHNLTRLAVGELALGRELAEAGSTDEAAQVYRALAVVEAQIGVAQGATAQLLDAEAIAAQTAGQFARAIELDERALAVVRSRPHRPADEAEALFSVAFSYNLAGAWVKMREASEAQLALLPDDEVNRANRASTLESIGYACLYSTGAASAIPWLRRAIELDRQIKADDTNAVISLGVALVQVGQVREARALMEKALPALLAAVPPRPWRRATASFTLARALWEDGDAHDRARARVLAADAEHDLVDSIDQLSSIPTATSSVRILEDRLADLRSWRLRHV